MEHYYDTTPFLNHAFDTSSAADIVSVHAKDTILSGLERNDQGLLTVCRLNEAVPGKGKYRYATLLRRAAAYKPLPRRRWPITIAANILTS